MGFLATLFIFSIWLIVVLRKKVLSWNSIVNIYFAAVILTDIVDISLSWFFSTYKLPGYLLKDRLADYELGVVISDGFILPFMAIIFCHYLAKNLNYLRADKKITQLLFFALIMVFIELILRDLKFMLYVKWHTSITLFFYLCGLGILTAYARRLIFYSPPIPYQVRIFFATFALQGWPGAILEGALLRFYQYRPGIFNNPSADDRFTSMSLLLVIAAISAFLIPKLPVGKRKWAFIGIALFVILFDIFLYHKGWILYNRWNHLLLIIRFSIPAILLIFYDKWETRYELSVT